MQTSLPLFVAIICALPGHFHLKQKLVQSSIIFASVSASVVFH